jgi:hypothetical protein
MFGSQPWFVRLVSAHAFLSLSLATLLPALPGRAFASAREDTLFRAGFASAPAADRAIQPAVFHASRVGFTLS